MGLIICALTYIETSQTAQLCSAQQASSTCSELTCSTFCTRSDDKNSCIGDSCRSYKPVSLAHSVLKARKPCVLHDLACRLESLGFEPLKSAGRQHSFQMHTAAVLFLAYRHLLVQVLEKFITTWQRWQACKCWLGNQYQRLLTLSITLTRVVRYNVCSVPWFPTWIQPRVARYIIRIFFGQ